MGVSRRRWLKQAMSVAMLPIMPAGAFKPGDRLFDLRSLEKFVDPLPIPATSACTTNEGLSEHRIVMRQFQKKCHRDLPPATFWGYDGACPGPTIEAHRGKPIAVEWVNELPTQHLFAIDHSLHGAEADKPAVRTVTHVHGARVQAGYDGYPESWFVPGQSARYVYPNEQDATALFYHDHAMGITRLNTAAGLLGFYLLRDEVEASLRLPSGRYEIPIALFDRSFRADGQLFYPVSNKLESPWVSEYYGGGILANGALFPYLDVEPRIYRFRLLNSSNGSFYRLSFGTDTNGGSKAESFHVIGSDQGLHSQPAPLEKLLLGPGERTDLLFDFAPFQSKRLHLRTDTGATVQFRVGAEPVKEDFKIPANLRRSKSFPVSASVKERFLTLGDSQDRLGHSHIMLLNGCHWDMPVTENPVLNSVEIWSFINLTDDSHPIHLHQVRFQIIDRQNFDLAAYQLTNKLVFTDKPSLPEVFESGWKDTVRVDPLTVTRIIARFGPYSGRYVWHCHMLEHEDNEMMRPYDIVPAEA